MAGMLRILLAAGICFAALAAWTGSSRSDATTGPGKIRITSRQVEYNRVDVGPRGRTPGDMEIVNSLLYNRGITPRAIGHAELVCTFTVGPSRNCRATVFLPKGKLIVGGTLRFRQLYEFAILGGTGLYDNARGTLTVTQRRRNPRRELLLFRLVG